MYKTGDSFQLNLLLFIQELDLSKEAFVFLESPKEEEWSRAVAAGLHPAATYVMVRLVRLVGMMLLVYTKQEHEQFITNVAVDTVGTGIMGKLGNKATVTCHLARLLNRHGISTFSITIQEFLFILNYF